MLHRKEVIQYIDSYMMEGNNKRYDIFLLQAITICFAKKALFYVTSNTIANCFCKCGFNFGTITAEMSEEVQQEIEGLNWETIVGVENGPTFEE